MELIKARTLDASNGIHAERRLDVEFVFYVKHQALLYLVNKAVFSGRICIWFLLLKDLDSSIVTRPLRSDVAAYHLSRLRNGEGPEGVPAPRRFFLFSSFIVVGPFDIRFSAAEMYSRRAFPFLGGIRTGGLARFLLIASKASWCLSSHTNSSDPFSFSKAENTSRLPG